MTARTWGENVAPTAQQLADWLGACTDDERLDAATRFLDASDRAHRCFLMDHEGAVRQLEVGRDEYRAGFMAACEEIRDGLAAQQ